MKDKKIAIFELGGKQYLVSEGEVLSIDNFPGDEVTGDKFVADKVLLVHEGEKTQIGTPYADGAKVECKIAEQGRSKKISVIRFRSKSRYFRNKGHRQDFTKLEIVKIS